MSSLADGHRRRHEGIDAVVALWRDSDEHSDLAFALLIRHLTGHHKRRFGVRYPAGLFDTTPDELIAVHEQLHATAGRPRPPNPEKPAKRDGRGDDLAAILLLVDRRMLAAATLVARAVAERDGVAFPMSALRSMASGAQGPHRRAFAALELAGARQTNVEIPLDDAG